MTNAGKTIIQQQMDSGRSGTRGYVSGNTLVNIIIVYKGYNYANSFEEKYRKIAVSGSITASFVTERETGRGHVVLGAIDGFPQTRACCVCLARCFDRRCHPLLRACQRIFEVH
jgi:hypothetical protein